MQLRRAVFLDRDGVLNRERKDYVKNPDELEILSGVARPLKLMCERGFLIVVVTNQSAVGRGLLTHEVLNSIHDKMTRDLGRDGCSVDAVYYCPHTPKDGCDCRKPRPGLILRAARDLGIHLQESWLIGDNDSDIEAARRAGCRAVKVPANDDGLAIGVNQILRSEAFKAGEVLGEDPS